MFEFGERRPQRSQSLTPMIDVVFLLVVFFMLAAQFGADKALQLGAPAQGTGTYQGAPRLVGITAEGVSLNGRSLPPAELISELSGLMPTPDAVVILRPDPGVPLERAVQVIDLMRAAGISRIVLTEPGE